jgi:hypothetical protein
MESQMGQEKEDTKSLIVKISKETQEKLSLIESSID